MTEQTHFPAPRPQRGLAGYLASFRRDESGSMIIFALFILVLMLMIGGLGVDLMRLEITRTKLQNTLDRAVLAAADRDQTRPPVQVVQDYFAKAGMSSYLNGTPVVSTGLNYSTVSANAVAQVPMMFSALDNVFRDSNRIGTVDAMTVATRSTATEMVAKVEISMVLDISGSMSTNNKLTNLKSAANTFVDTVLTTGNANRISISLVPYSEHVNVGPTLYNQLLTTTRHNFSHCLEIPNSHFTSTALTTTYRFLQAQHYQWNFDGSANDRSNTVCPRDTYMRIRPWSQNATQLKSQITSFQPRAGTSIFLGLKWGVAMLDPSTRGIVTNLIGSGLVSSAFAGRPVAYTDPETTKVVILMTDGKNDNSNRIQNWAYDSSSEYTHWENYNFWYYMYYYVSAYNRASYYQAYYTPTIGDNLTDQMCDAAKAQGIIIWSIAFETDAHGSSVMEQCASSPSHFFDVDGAQISTAFSTIAGQINNLKLVN